MNLRLTRPDTSGYEIKANKACLTRTDPDDSDPPLRLSTRCSRRSPIETSSEAAQMFQYQRIVTFATQSACCHPSPHFHRSASSRSQSTEIASTSDAEGTYHLIVFVHSFHIHPQHPILSRTIRTMGLRNERQVYQAPYFHRNSCHAVRRSILRGCIERCPAHVLRSGPLRRG